MSGPDLWSGCDIETGDGTCADQLADRRGRVEQHQITVLHLRGHPSELHCLVTAEDEFREPGTDRDQKGSAVRVRGC